MVRKKIASALIVSGMLVFFYPLLSHAFTCYWQQRIFNEWERGLRNGEIIQVEIGEPGNTVLTAHRYSYQQV